ncbi:hypothetical protein M1563_05165 [Patescibacteria group bacterium]|nr:hypothetical protein [Patescibacteria group bacterium]
MLEEGKLYWRQIGRNNSEKWLMSKGKVTCSQIDLAIKEQLAKHALSAEVATAVKKSLGQVGEILMQGGLISVEGELIQLGTTGINLTDQDRYDANLILGQRLAVWRWCLPGAPLPPSRFATHAHTRAILLSPKLIGNMHYWLRKENQLDFWLNVDGKQWGRDLYDLHRRALPKLVHRVYGDISPLVAPSTIVTASLVDMIDAQEKA